jgi:hypothetical protein
MNKIERELRILKFYALFMTVTCVVLFGLIFKSLHLKKFDEIDVERINVVESDGKLRMVISNQNRQHPGIMDGITYDERKGQRPPGMIFFNAKGDESGGLVFDGNAGQGQGGSLTFDKFRGDQTIQFIHEEDQNGKYFSGVKMNDQNMPLNDLMSRQKEIDKLPTKEVRDSAYKILREQGLLMTERLKVGKDYDGAAVIALKDAKGKVRLEMKVGASGESKIDFLDDAGKIIYSLPK